MPANHPANDPSFAAQRLLARGSLLLLLRFLIIRVATFYGVQQAQQWVPLDETARSSAGGVCNTILFLLLHLAFFWEGLRRHSPMRLITSIAILSGLASALNGNQGGGFLNVNWVEVTEKLEDAGIKLPFGEGVSLADLTSLSLNLTPSALVALPAAAAGAAAVGAVTGGLGVLSSLAGLVAAAVAPYVLARTHAAVAGWGALSWAATLGTCIAGALHTVWAGWVLWVVRRHAAGLTVTGKTMALADPDSGGSPADAAFLAASAAVNALLLPEWALVLWVRWGVWALTCGACCAGHAAARRAKLE